MSTKNIFLCDLDTAIILRGLLLLKDSTEVSRDSVEGISDKAYSFFNFNVKLIDALISEIDALYPSDDSGVSFESYQKYKELLKN